MRDFRASGSPFHHMPYGFGGDMVTPDRAASADTAKYEASSDPCSLHPGIHCPLDPARHRNRSDVLALPDSIGHNPVFLSDLKVVGLQPNQLGTPETASDEYRQDCPIPLPPQSVRTRRA